MSLLNLRALGNRQLEEITISPFSRGRYTTDHSGALRNQDRFAATGLGKRFRSSRPMGLRLRGLAMSRITMYSVDVLAIHHPSLGPRLPVNPSISAPTTPRGNILDPLTQPLRSTRRLQFRYSDLAIAINLQARSTRTRTPSAVS